MKKISGLLKKIGSEHGAAMIWALLVFMTVSVVVMSVLMIQGADVREIMFLENKLAAYYASLGGMELGYSALMTSYPAGSSDFLFDWYVKETQKFPNRTLHHNYDYTDSAGKVVATAVITVRLHNAYEHPWVLVESVGTDLASGIRSVNYLRIDLDNINEVYRDGSVLH